jgi:N-6 DNA Methylase
VLNALGDENGLPRLGLIGLGGIYDSIGTDEILRGLELSNEHLLAAVKCLARVRDQSTGRWRKVDYRNLGPEELGSIYQNLLEFVPKWTKEERRFLLDVLPGNERKKTGSYYTPTSLIDCLLDSALDPVLDDATKRAEVAATQAGTDVSTAIADALLKVTVCDPACGSGHFLVAAARRIAKRLASVREHNPEPTTDALRAAVRDVVKHCIYGVDVNPLAVELAKVSLWLEAVEPGKALGFLDAHIKCGDALIGATPALIDNGIPDDAFKAIEGDDPPFAASLRRANAPVNAGQDELFSDEFIFAQSNEQLAARLAQVADAPDGSLSEVHRQAAAYYGWKQSAENERQHEIADAWCAAIVWVKDKKSPPAIVNRVFSALCSEGPAAIPPATVTEIARLRAEFAFFHWHLEFPGIFHVPGHDSPAGWSGGFDCLLGNPPWDKVDFEDKKYFASVEPSIAVLAGQKRRARIVEWQLENPVGADQYQAARRKIKATFHFASNSRAFPLCARGLTLMGVTKLQIDQLFAEQFAARVASIGRVGCIIPTAVATAAGGQYLFRDLIGRGAVASIYDFENSKPLFPDVHTSYKFCLLALAGAALSEPETRLAFFLLDTSDLDDAGRVFALGPEEVALLNPNTRTLPIFRSQKDANLTTSIYHRIPVLWDETVADGNSWSMDIKATFFHMTDDSDLFRTRETLDSEGWQLRGNVYTRASKRMLPLYEGKMTHHFDHRWNSYYDTGNEDRRRLTFTEKQDPSARAQPRYWIEEDGLIDSRRNGKAVKVPGVSRRLAEMGWEPGWLCGWRDVTSATNERTAIPAFVPRAAVGNSIALMLPRVSPALTAALIATQSSLVFDFVSRQKTGTAHMNPFSWKQLPVPTPAALEPHTGFITPCVLELVYTAYDMTPLARDLDDTDGPFHWDEERRFMIRAELDAFFFQLYGIERADVDYIMETFPIVKQNDVKAHGSYRTKETILDLYDRMAAADAAGLPYQTPITPPPGHGPRHPADSGE